MAKFLRQMSSETAKAAAGLIAKTKQMSGEQFPAEPRRPAQRWMGPIGSFMQRHCRTAVTAWARAVSNAVLLSVTACKLEWQWRGTAVMKLFNCQSCQQILYFENTVCVKSGHRLGYILETATLAALGASPSWSSCSHSARRWGLSVVSRQPYAGYSG